MSHNTSGIQTLAATVIVSGPQLVKIDTHGTGGRGSYTVSTPHVMVTVHDLRADADIWADMKGDATFLPAQRPVDIEKLAHVMPGLVITAYGKDQTRGIYRPDRREIAIRVGYVTWIVTDKQAYHAVANAWETAQQMSHLWMIWSDRCSRSGVRSVVHLGM